MRVFHDRLISDHDRELVKYDETYLFSFSKLTKIIRGIINQLIVDKFPDFKEHALADPILFGDFRNAAQDTEDVRIYEDLKDYDSLKPIFEG